MLSRLFGFLVLFILSFYLTGCTVLAAKKVDNLDDPPKGVRVYPTTVYLFVDEGEKGADGKYLSDRSPSMKCITLPDARRAYDVKPRTFLAKQDFQVDLVDGQITTLKANQDTTAIIELFKRGAELGAKAAGVSVSQQSISGTCGLKGGVYRLRDDGTWEQIAGK
jgi:hypothetical protein